MSLGLTVKPAIVHIMHFGRRYMYFLSNQCIAQQYRDFFEKKKKQFEGKTTKGVVMMAGRII